MRTSSNTPLPSHSGHLSKAATYLRRQGSRRKGGSNYCLSIAHHKTFADSNNYILFLKYFWISVRKFLPGIGIRLFWRDNGSLYLDTLFPSVPPSEEGKQSFVTHLGHHPPQLAAFSCTSCGAEDMVNVILLRKLSISAPKLFSVTKTGEPSSYIRMTINFPWLRLNRVTNLSLDIFQR